ncbi:MAG: TonB-dependent receptor [Alphaproteobacteria bacterium]|nr:TonB-dependent receptor [Alphaproteobacteria bacterium]
MKGIASLRVIVPALTSLLLLNNNASAQQTQNTTQAASSGGLEVVTVTAERKTENEQTVPIAITALEGSSLQRDAVVSAQDLAQRVPSFTFSDFAPGESILSIRGVSSTDDGAGTESSVAEFMDDVYIGRMSNQAFDLYDLQRIEVLRGPQGTFFGKNAIGGAINIVSTPVATDQPHAFASLGYGNFNQITAQGTATGPLTRNLAGKIAFYTSSHDGWDTNVVTGNKIDSRQSVDGRVALLYHSDDDHFRVQLNADYMHEYQFGLGRIPIRDGSVPIVELMHLHGGNGWNKTTDAGDYPMTRSAKGVSIKANLDIWGGELTSITAVRRSAADWEHDSVGIPEINLINGVHDYTDQFSQEFRFNQQVTDTIDYVAGLYYLVESTDRERYFHFIIPPPASDLESSHQFNTTHSYAAFINGDWAFAKQWKLSAGVRFTTESKMIRTVDIGPQNGFINIIPTSFTASAHKSWTDVSPRVSLQYQPSPSSLIYATLSQGFKSGGFAAEPATVKDATTPLNPETATNYELGFKNDFFDHHARLNVAAYYTSYHNLQVQRFGPPLNQPTQFGRFQTLNAPDEEMKGVEAEAIVRPVTGLTLDASYSYLEATFSKFIYVDSAGTAVNLHGTSLLRAPKNKVTAAADYTLDGPFNGAWDFHYEWRYTGTQLAELADPSQTQPAFTVSDANITWMSNDNRWSAELWGKNLFNEHYISELYVIGPGGVGVFGEPRTYGVTVRYRLD